ncbi:hypothetical protein GXW78_25180 [Roseomonas terrae]|uniref:Uncharacterized protein n=1 Tax=Neoroseomonas terrae TaxID=424799 RepID=A0ABS5EPN9_9PROT|nr:hypothetical protein [Neoroseomonas terrae]MBR0652973.1 hypothetical protein [Neoroseomonas terrae]
MNELDTLKKLLDAEHVKLGISIRRMNSPGSPVYRSGENVWPPAVALGASLVALKWGGIPLEWIGIEQGGAWAGTVVLALGCWWWLTKIMPKVKDGVFDRSATYALQSPARFDSLWSQGVLSLYAKMPDGTERAATQRDSWRAFVTAIDQELEGQG